MKHSFTTRLISFVLSLLMVFGMLPLDAVHVHATETHSVDNEDTNLEIDYKRPPYKVDENGDPVYDENNQLIYLSPLQALSEAAESGREIDYTYNGEDLTYDDFYSDDYSEPQWRQVFKGDFNKLREWLESDDPDDRYIVLMEDIKKTIGGSSDWEAIEIKSQKVLDLNGHTLEFYDKRNGTTDQNSENQYHRSNFITINGTGYTQGDDPLNPKHGALLTVIDSAGSNVTITDPKGEIYKKNPQTGRIYANGYMINHQKWDFWWYTHRDLFWVLDGDLVIYGGEFQAGRQKDQAKSNFTWGNLKTVIGDAVALGTSIFEYASGITAAEAARSDLMGGDMFKDLKEDIAGSDEDEKDTGKTNNGKTNKKDGTGGTEEKKTDTPTSKGEDAAKKDQTVAQKQNDKNSKGEDEAKKGGDSKENKAETGKDAKPAKKDPTDSQIAEANKAIGAAYLDKDKISGMVDSGMKLIEGIWNLFTSEPATIATACIHGTVARIGGECAVVIYDGNFIGHGSTPNVRNAVFEVYHNPNPSATLEGKTQGGLMYIYGGTFTANAGANVFNMYKTNGQPTAKMYEIVTTQTVDPVSAQVVYTHSRQEVTKYLDVSETFGVEEVRYENLEKWAEKYYAIPEAQRTEYEALQTSAEKAAYTGLTAEQKAIIDEGPEPVNTANIMVRGGAFRTYYEISMMAVLDARTKGTDESDGQWCPVHEKYGDDCDDVDHNKFIGTPGTVNLGVESFGEDMIKDGRIQLVDVYGQGKLVLLDGGDPIYENPEADPYEGMTEEEILAAEQEKREEEGEVTATPVNTYQTEGGFRQYRLYISDLELRAMQYLTVQPNTALTNSTNASFALKTYWGTGNSVAVDGWASDDDNIRAPYSSNEHYFEYQFDAPEAQRGVYIMPELGNMDYDAAGEELATSDVWYYNIPVNASGETLGNFQFMDTYMSGHYEKEENEYDWWLGLVGAIKWTINEILADGNMLTGDYQVSMNRLRKSGSSENTGKYKDKLTDKDYYTVTDENYRTNIKFFVYRVYRVDPLSRENINESDTWAADEPLLEMRYGATNDSLKCKITLAELEKAIAEKKGDPDWGFRSGELYRVTFSVEEHLGYGYLGSQEDGEVEFVNHMQPARAESSILFRCVSINENKDGTHVNGSTGASGAGKVPDWTPLQFVKQNENGEYYKDETVSPGGYATVELLNGQTGIIDYEGARIFDVYYQWYILDDPNDTTPTLIAGTDDVWVAQNPYGGKQFHKPGMWALKEDGTGANGNIYASTVDPSSELAAKYNLNAYGMPVDQDDWIEEGYQMLHMYTYETCNAHPGMIKDPDQGGLYMANNNTFWGNTDSIYVPAEYAGKYLQCKLVAVNTRYPQVFDNLQTIESHIIPITGIAIPGFDKVTPEPLNGNEYGGYSKLGDVYKDTVPTFSFSALPLDEELRDQGYTLELLTIDKVDGEVVGTIYNGKPYTPKEYGEHELSMIITMVDAAGKRLNSLTQVYTFNLRFKPMFTKLSPNASKAELEAGVKDMGNTAVHTLTFEYEPLPQFMYDQGYRQYFRVDGTNTGSGNEVTVEEYENGAKVSLNGLYYNYSIKPIIELYNIYGEEVAETSITYKLSPTVGLCFTGLTPSVTAAQIANKEADLGTVYEPVTVSYDDVVIPSWVDSTVARLYSASMDVYRDGEHVDRYLFDRGEKSYTATVFGDYEIVLTQNIINAGGDHEETFTYKFTYAAPELKFTNLTPAPTAAEYEAGKKDLGLVSAPTVFSYELLTLTEQQIADGYKVRASMDIYDAEGNKVTGIAGEVNNNVFYYTHSLLGEYRIVLKQTLYCQVEEGGGVSYSESVEFEYTVNQTNDFLLSFGTMIPEVTPEELEAGLTELGYVESGYVFDYEFVSLPQWMYEAGYQLDTSINDYVNDQMVGFGDARYAGYPVSSGGDHVVEFVQTLTDPAGNVEQTIKHTFTCTIVPATAESIVIAPNYYSAEISNALIAGSDDWAVITMGETLPLTATVYPSDAVQGAVWSSDNTAVATVDDNGLITPVGRGKCTITVTDYYGTVSDTFIVHVDEPSDDYIVWVGGVPLEDGQYLASGSTTPTTTKPASGGYAYCNGNTLMLNNFDVGDNACFYINNYGEYIMCGAMVMNAGGKANVNIQGENDLIPDLDYGQKDGLAMFGTTTIEGNNPRTAILHGDIQYNTSSVTIYACIVDGVSSMAGNPDIYAVSAKDVTFNGSVSAKRQVKLERCTVNAGVYCMPGDSLGGIVTVTNGTVLNGSDVEGYYVTYDNSTHNGGEIFGAKQVNLSTSDINVDEIWLEGTLDSDGYSGTMEITDCNIRVRQIIAPTLNYTTTDGTHSFAAVNPGGIALDVNRGVNVSWAGSDVSFNGSTIDDPGNMIPFVPEYYKDYCYVTTEWSDEDYYALNTGKVFMAYKQLQHNEKLAQDSSEPTTDWPETGYAWYYIDTYQGTNHEFYLNGYNKNSAVMEVYGMTMDIIVSSYGDTTSNSFGKIFGWNSDLRFISTGCSVNLNNSDNALTAANVFVNGPEIYLNSANGTALIADEIKVKDGIIVASGQYAVEGNVDPETHLVMVGSSASDLTVWNGTTSLENYQYVTIRHKHTLTHHEAVPHTCTEDGILEHYACDDCGRIYADEACTEELSSTTDWASRHNYVGGCTTPRTCADCGMYFADATGEDHVWEEANCRHPERCANCGETRGELGDHILENATGSGVTYRKEATCSEEGMIAGNCIVCKTYVEQTIPKLAHTFDNATCAKPGTCTVCGEVGYDALAHTMDEGVVTIEPACVTEGVMTYTCTVCGHTETEAIEPNGIHVYADATCTAPRTCIGCGITEGVKLEHNLNEGVVTKAPTCSAEGILKRTCSDCGETVEEAIPMTDHNITSVATCSEPAKCGDCGLYIGLAAAHAWVDATCDAPQTCANCGATEGEALGHNWIEATCDHPKLCTNCGETIGSALGHTWKAATCSEPKTCTTCWATEGKALGHTWDVNDCTVERTCTVCSITREAGDHSVSFTTITELEHSGNCDECGAAITQKHYYGDDVVCDDCGYEHTHSLTHIPAKDATCTTTGNVEYWTCSVCGNSYSDESATTLITETTIPETGHTEVVDAAVAATCTITGLTEGSHCSVCDTVIVAQETIPALGHNMVDGTCTRCGYSEAVDGPQIVSQPVDYVGMVGDTATFTVVAEGEGLKYQWYFYDTNLSSWQKSPGNTSATMSVEFKAYRNNQEYRCEITDSDGNTITTNVVKIVAQVVDLVIVTQPVDYVGSVNDNVSFTVEATGNGLTYQWYYSDNGGTTWVKSGTPGFATNNLLPILRTYRDGFVYYCQITDIFGNTVNSNVVSMTVKASEIVITKKPVDVNGAKLGELYYFESEATGDNLEFRWEFSKDGGETWELSWNQGYNTPTLGVRMNANRDGYLYRCKIVSGLKTVVYTEPVSLNLQAPSAQIVTQPTNVATIVNKTIKFQVQATGTDLTYKWYRSNDKGATWIETFLSGYNTDTLSFVATNARAAMYMCKITDGSGKAIWSSPVKLQILSAELKILTQPESITCASGATATFTVEAQGDGLKYQWYASSDGGATWAVSYLGGYNTDTFSFVVNASRAAKLYKCVITDAGGNTVETNYVSVTIG